MKRLGNETRLGKMKYTSRSNILLDSSTLQFISPTERWLFFEKLIYFSLSSPLSGSISHTVTLCSPLNSVPPPAPPSPSLFRVKPYNQRWFDYSAWLRSFFVISLHKCLRSITETQTEQTDRGDILMLKWPLPFSIYRLKALLCFLRLLLILLSLAVIPLHLSVYAPGSHFCWGRWRQWKKARARAGIHKDKAPRQATKRVLRS